MFHTPLRKGAFTAALAATLAMGGTAASAETRVTLKSASSTSSYYVHDGAAGRDAPDSVGR